MAISELPAIQPVSVSITAEHYVSLWWRDEHGCQQNLKLNPGQALAIGGFANLAQQSYEFSRKES